MSASSAAVTVGHSALNYFFCSHDGDPVAIANRIIVLHSLASSLLTAAQSLHRVAVARVPTPRCTEHNDNQWDNDQPASKNADNQINPQVIADTVSEGLQLVRQADTGLHLANVATTSSVYVSTAVPAATSFVQSSANMLATVPVLGTALAGIFIAMDANRLQSTLQKISAGDPCQKADALLAMQGDLLLFPQTADLEMECQTCCQVIFQQQTWHATSGQDPEENTAALRKWCPTGSEQN